MSGVHHLRVEGLPPTAPVLGRAPGFGLTYECRLVERILYPLPRKGLVDRIWWSASIGNARPHVVVDLDRDGQRVLAVESLTDHKFVNITEHMASAHRAVDVDPRQSSDPSRQMLVSFGQLLAASELWPGSSTRSSATTARSAVVSRFRTPIKPVRVLRSRLVSRGSLLATWIIKLATLSRWRGCPRAGQGAAQDVRERRIIRSMTDAGRW